MDPALLAELRAAVAEDTATASQSTATATGGTGLASAANVESAAQVKPAADPIQAQPDEDWDESSDDEDEDLHPPGPDGIRRRIRKPDQQAIRPSYYYPLPDGAASNFSKGVPVFEPTMEEFHDFYKQAALPLTCISCS